MFGFIPGYVCTQDKWPLKIVALQISLSLGTVQMVPCTRWPYFGIKPEAPRHQQAHLIHTVNSNPQGNRRLLATPNSMHADDSDVCKVRTGASF